MAATPGSKLQGRLLYFLADSVVPILSKTHLQSGGYSNPWLGLLTRIRLDAVLLQFIDP